MSASLVYVCDDCRDQLDTAVIDPDAARRIRTTLDRIAKEAQP